MASERDEPETATERFEDFGRNIFRVTKNDLTKAEEAVEKVVDEARRMGDTVNEPIQVGTLPRRILTDIATPRIDCVSPPTMRDSFQAKGRFISLAP